MSIELKRIYRTMWRPAMITLLTAGLLWSCGPEENIGSSVGGAPETLIGERDTDDTDSGSDGTTTSESLSSSFLQWSVFSVDAPVFEKLSKAKKSELYAQFRKRHAPGVCRTVDGDAYCRVRKILEEVLRHPAGISSDIRTKLKKYLLQLWVFGGNVNRMTGQKVIPTFIPGELGAATLLAIRNGANIDVSTVHDIPLEANNIEQLEALLAEIRPYIFGREEVVAEDNRASLSDKGDAPERQGTEKPVSSALSPKYAGTGTASTPIPADDTDTNGASERAEPGFYLYIEDPDFEAMLKKLELKADYFDKKVREVGGTKSTAPRVQTPLLTVAHLLDVDDTAGPLISDEQDLYGFGITASVTTHQGMKKRALWLNVNEAFEAAAGSRVTTSLSVTPTVEKRRRERRQLVSVAYYALRQLAGFGADGTENKPPHWLSERLGEHNEIIRILRADLTALYLIYDEELAGTGLIPDVETRNALLDEYLYSALESVAAGKSPHMYPFLMARIVVLNYLRNENVLNAMFDDNGKLRLHIPDYEKLRTPVIQLLGRVRNIRFFGDRAKADALLKEYAYLQAGWGKRLQEEFDALEIGRSYLMLLPLLSADPMPAHSKKTGVSVHLRLPRSVYERYSARGGI